MLKTMNNFKNAYFNYKNAFYKYASYRYAIFVENEP